MTARSTRITIVLSLTLALLLGTLPGGAMAVCFGHDGHREVGAPLPEACPCAHADQHDERGPARPDLVEGHGCIDVAFAAADAFAGHESPRLPEAVRMPAPFGAPLPHAATRHAAPGAPRPRDADETRGAAPPAPAAGASDVLRI